MRLGYKAIKLYINGLPAFETGAECARHSHPFVQIHQWNERLIFIVALFQRIQISVFFDVAKQRIHHHAGFVIWNVRDHCGRRDWLIRAAQHVIDVVLSIRANDKRASVSLRRVSVQMRRC